MGAPGSGKALTAISTFLRLTDVLEQPGQMDGLRTVLFFDARRKASQPGFGTDAWFEQRLQDAQAAGHGRPIVIMPHADAYLSRQGVALRDALTARVFTEADVVLCCNELFYEKALRWEDWGTHIVRLKPWDTDFQHAFVRALHNEDTLTAFQAWRDEDDSRGVLCQVPLHLAYVLSLITEDSATAQGISRRSQLFEKVARVRVRVAGNHGGEDALMDELAALAHRFYRSGTPTDAAICFTEEDLRDYLEARAKRDVEGRYQTLTRKTLLAAPTLGTEELRFEDGLWGWFFAAYHLARTLQRGAKPLDVLRAFGRFYSPNVMEPCEEILHDRLVRHDEPIIASLRGALEADDGPAMSPGTRRIAREQIAYLLGALANEGLTGELAVMLDRASPRYEHDELIRRALAVGMANGGEAEFADWLADELREERQAGGPSPIADANIGFLLSFRGDQPFNIDHPAIVEPDPNPVRLIAHLVSNLADGRHPASRRIKLATLMDLAHPARIKPERFNAAILPHREVLLALLDRRDKHLVPSDWPEVGELRAVLEGVPDPREPA